MVINSGIPTHYPLTLTHTHTLIPAHTDKCPEFVFSRVANLEQYLAVAGPSLLHQPRSLPSLMEAWHSLVPAHIKQRKCHTELPLLVRSEVHKSATKINEDKMLYRSVPGKRPLPGKRPCTAFQGVNVVASIQMYGIYIPSKHPCWPK